MRYIVTVCLLSLIARADCYAAFDEALGLMSSYSVYHISSAHLHLSAVQAEKHTFHPLINTVS